MKATVSYSELSEWVGQRFKIAPTFKRVDDKVLEVSYNPGLFVPTVRVTLKIEAMRKDVICLSYDCSMAVSMLIAGTVGHLQDKIPQGVEVKPEDKRINLYLDRIDKLDKALEYVAPTDISFSEEEICLTLSLL